MLYAIPGILGTLVLLPSAIAFDTPKNGGKIKCVMEFRMKPTKPYTQMNAAELAQATRQYEQMVIDKTIPLNAKERRLWEQAQRGRAQPKVGTPARKISILLQDDLLQKTDTLASKRGLNRSELISSFVLAGLRRAG